MAGVLVPTHATIVRRAPRTKSRLSDKHGSMTMQDVKGDKNKRKAQDGEKAAAAAGKRQRAADAKAEVARDKEARDAAFAICEVECACGMHDPVPVGRVKCGPKKGLCKVRECSAARNPLLLGFNPAVGGRRRREDARFACCASVLFYELRAVVPRGVRSGFPYATQGVPLGDLAIWRRIISAVDDFGSL
jgi:hypothetical protein